MLGFHVENKNLCLQVMQHFRNLTTIANHNFVQVSCWISSKVSCLITVTKYLAWVSFKVSSLVTFQASYFINFQSILLDYLLNQTILIDYLSKYLAWLHPKVCSVTFQSILLMVTFQSILLDYLPKYLAYGYLSKYLSWLLFKVSYLITVLSILLDYLYKYIAWLPSKVS